MKKGLNHYLSRYLQNWKDKKAENYIAKEFEKYDNEKKQETYKKINDLYSTNNWVMHKDVIIFFDEHLLGKHQEDNLIGDLVN